MKILFCTTTFETGSNGPTKFINILEENLTSFDQSIDLHILSEDISTSSPYLHKVNISFLGQLFRFIGMLYKNIPYFFHIRRLNKLHQFDVIWHNNAITGLLSAWLIKTPQLGMINDALSVTTSFQNFSFSKTWIRHWCFSCFEKIGFKYYMTIIANSKFLKDILVDRYSIKESKIITLYKSINTTSTYQKEACPEKKLAKKNKIKILFVKSNYIIGGLNDLLDALLLLPYTFDLNIVGPSSKNLNAFLKTLKSYPNINIACLGKLENNEILKLHLQMDLFCTPSISEALGVANMEALYMETPVVYRNVGGVNEVLDHGNNGFVANDSTIKSLAAALKHCINNDELRQMKVVAGKKYVINNFSSEEMLKKFITISKGAQKKILNCHL